MATQKERTEKYLAKAREAGTKTVSVTLSPTQQNTLLEIAPTLSEGIKKLIDERSQHELTKIELTLTREDIAALMALQKGDIQTTFRKIVDAAKKKTKV